MPKAGAKMGLTHFVRSLGKNGVKILSAKTLSSFCDSAVRQWCAYLSPIEYFCPFLQAIIFALLLPRGSIFRGGVEKSNHFFLCMCHGLDHSPVHIVFDYRLFRRLKCFLCSKNSENSVICCIQSCWLFIRVNTNI